MKITDIELYSNNVLFMTFSLQKANFTDSHLIKSIAGLDAEDIVPMYYGYGLNSNTKYYEYSLKPRDIVMRIGLNPNFTINESYGGLRETLYKAISSSRSGIITLKFLSNGVAQTQIFGRIVKFEVVYFTKEPEVQITFNCTEPLFKAINSTLITGIASANPVLVTDNVSTAPHGFKLQATFIGSVATFTIQDAAATPEWMFQIIPASPFAIGDVLYLSSEKNNKYIYMVRSGVTTYLMDKVLTTSVWSILFPGNNVFYIPEIIGAITINNIEHYASYWGV
jgi:hypothetical protein